MIWELLRVRPRLVVLIAVAAGLAGCSSEATRFNDNRYAAQSAPPQPAAMSAVAPSPSGTIEQSQLPPPSGASGPVSSAPDAGFVGGGRSMGMASYQPTAAVPDVTGSAAPRRPASQWSWEGGTAIIVVPGETIDIIAQRHGVPADALMQANSLPPGSAVRPGQRLVIPRYNAGSPAIVPTASVPTASAPTASVAAARPSPAPVAALSPSRPATVTGTSGLHVVASGDTLYKISRIYGRSVPDLAKANNIEPTATLKIGDRIVIPGGATASAGVKSAPRAAQPLAAPSAKAAKAAVPKATPAKAAPAPKQTEQPQQAALVTPSDDTPPPTVTKSTDGAPSFRWPVKGRIIAGFGPKSNGQQNDGINLAVPEGTPVKAAEDGVVAYAGNELKGYGNLVLIRHANGYVTAYAHAKEILVKRGDQIKRGQVIANSGQTGNVDAPQLHFEVRKGPAPLDPMPLLGGG